jgi:beta-mannosidase
MRRLSLNGPWDLVTFRQRESPIRAPEDLDGYRERVLPASVPGNVALDLARAGELPSDLFFGDNIHQLRPYELHEWWYQRAFTVPAGDEGRCVELVFHGVDCFATVWLDGEELGQTANALLEHRFDVSDRLRPGETHTLTVRLRSPLLEALRYPYDPSLATWNAEIARLWVRKPAHSYGWDIMPRALSEGLWRSVALVIHDDHEIRDLTCFTQALAPDRATLGLYIEIATAPERLPELSLRIEGRLNGEESGDPAFVVSRPIRFAATTVTFDVPDPKLWWPVGYGAPHLYDLTVTLMHGDRTLATRTVTTGIRTVDLVRTDVTSAESAGEFLFRINDVPILCKGTNWVPADAFHSRDAARIPKILEMAVDLGCNMIRCWGGGVYEDHDFYDRCDRTGMMVWQDFAMACGRYPQDPAFLATMREEAVAVARKLRRHPSIVLWSGDNECDLLYRNPAQNRITREMLPQAVAQADPGRPYLPSSPYVAPQAAGAVARGDRRLMPEQHLWGPRDYYKSAFYTQNTAHFVSEIGYHGCPNLSSIRRFIDADHLWPWQENDQWITHCTAPEGRDDRRRFRVKLMIDQVQELFGIEPPDLETLVLASQISQAEAKKFFVEMTRLGKWRRTGVIWWNLIDGWPQFSDAVVDYYFGKKLAYHYLRRVQRPLCLMIDEPHAWHVRLVAGNDSRTTYRGDYRVWDADTGETVLAGDFTSPTNTNAELGRIRVSHSDRRLFLISWTVDTTLAPTGEAGGGNHGGNHYLLGTPPFSLAQYRDWLAQIAALAPNIDAGTIGV